MSKDPADLLREHGVQVTAQRLAVLRAVSGRPHGTADDVAEVVRSEIGAISRQAVYDALGMLADKGLIRGIQPAGSPARFEDRVGDNHHHLICRDCDGVMLLDHRFLENLGTEILDDYGFKADIDHFAIFGVCKGCRSKAESA